MSKPTDGASIYIAEIAELTLQNESLTRENASLRTLHHPQTRWEQEEKIAKLQRELKTANRLLEEVEKRWDETSEQDNFEAQRLQNVIDAIRSILTFAD
jgi:hypothetical protein